MAPDTTKKDHSDVAFFIGQTLLILRFSGFDNYRVELPLISSLRDIPFQY